MNGSDTDIVQDLQFHDLLLDQTNGPATASLRRRGTGDLEDACFHIPGDLRLDGRLLADPPVQELVDAEFDIRFPDAADR